MGNINLSVVLIAAAATLAGCGPMIGPVVQRLPPDEQIQVEGMWNNMLTPVDRLDRGVLLDTIVTFGMYQQGIDRLYMKCEKQFAGGRAEIRLSFDRAKPAGDALEIDIFDDSGRRVRSEEYTSQEVQERMRRLWPPDSLPSTQPADAEANRLMSADLQSRIDAWAERTERVRAATQPAPR